VVSKWWVFVLLEVLDNSQKTKIPNCRESRVRSHCARLRIAGPATRLIRESGEDALWSYS
jgi:hypothetical protein